MLKKARIIIFLLIIAISYFNICIGDLRAETETTTIFSQAKDFYASDPECSLEILKAFYRKKVIMWMVDISASVILLLLPEPASKALANANMIKLAANIGSFLFNFNIYGPAVACTFGYVRHPILRFDEGPNDRKYKECDHGNICLDVNKNTIDFNSASTNNCYVVDGAKNLDTEFPFFLDIHSRSYSGMSYESKMRDLSSNYSTTKEPICHSGNYKSVPDYRWPKNRVLRSKYIEVCVRPMVSPFFPIEMIKAVGESIGMGIIGTDGSFEERFYTARERYFLYNFVDIFKPINGEVNFMQVIQRAAEFAESAPIFIANAWKFITTSKEQVNCHTMKAGEKAAFGVYRSPYGQGLNMVVEAKRRGGDICASVIGYHFSQNMPFGLPGVEVNPTYSISTLSGDVILGCHPTVPMPPAPMCAKSRAILDPRTQKLVAYNNSECYGCYIDPACYTLTGINSKSTMAVTSTVVECVKESLDNLLFKTCSGDSLLNKAKNNFRNIAYLVIVLAISIFGLKLATGGVNGAKDVILFVIKLAIVVLFSVGNGLETYYKGVINFGAAIADMTLIASHPTGICDFHTNEYIVPALKPGITLTDDEYRFYNIIISNKNRSNYDYTSANDLQTIAQNNGFNSAAMQNFIQNKMTVKDISYIAVWDRLDCRMGFYLGQTFSANNLIGLSFMIFVHPILALLVAPGVMLLMTASVTSFVIFISLVIWLVYVFTVCLLGLTIMALIAPLIFPMMLFQVTKNYFEGWLGEVVTYSLYPVTLFAFLSLQFTIYDRLFFGEFDPSRKNPLGGVSNPPMIEFVRKEIELNGNYKISFEPKTNVCQQDAYKYGLYCLMNNPKVVFEQLSLGAVGAAIPGTNMSWYGDKILLLIVYWMIINIMLFQFLGILGGLAAEITGNPRAARGIAGNMDAQQTVKKVLDLATGGADKMVKAKLGKAMSGGKKSDGNS